MLDCMKTVKCPKQMLEQLVDVSGRLWPQWLVPTNADSGFHFDYFIFWKVPPAEKKSFTALKVRVGVGVGVGVGSRRGWQLEYLTYDR